MGSLKSKLRNTWRMTSRAIGLPVRTKPIILMYHRIAAVSGDPWELCVSERNFAAQMEALKSRRSVLSLAEFSARLANGTLSANAAAITFDDGYACNAELAAPILLDKALHATIFLCSGMLDTARWFWWDALEEIVMAHRGTSLRLDVDPTREVFELGALDPASLRSQWRAFDPKQTMRQTAYLTIWSRLRSMSEDVRRTAMQSLHDQSGVLEAAPGNFRAMTWTQARWLAEQSLIEIGAHTVTHPALAEASEEVQLQEMTASVRDCERIIGRSIVSFAYPYGSYSAHTVAIARDIGLHQACTTNATPVDRTSSRLELPRYQVLNWNADEFLINLNI